MKFKLSIIKVICSLSILLMTSCIALAGVPSKTPLQCYSSKQVTTYNSANGSRWGYISANVDLIEITQINGEWAYGSYPTSKGRISRWFRLSDIVPNINFSNYDTGMYRASTAYRTENGSATIGSVYASDTVTVVYRGGSRSQVIYPVSGGYKMGWVSNNDIKSVSTNNTSTAANGYRDFSSSEKSSYASKKTTKQADIYNDPELRTQAGLHWAAGVTLSLSGMTSKAFKIEYNYGGIRRVGWLSKDIYDGANNYNSNGAYSGIEYEIYKRMEWLSTSVSGYIKGTKYSGDGECRGFANKVYQHTFKNVNYISGYSSNNYAASSYSGSYVAGKLYDFSANDVSAVKNLFLNIKPGAFIQMGRRYTMNKSKTAPGPHSAILYSVQSDGVKFFEANAGGTGRIEVNTYTWSQLADRNKGFTIYLPNSYTLYPWN